MFFLISTRHQLVNVSASHSSQEPISCGVPQGLILDFLLVLVYVDNMPFVVKQMLLLYADDSAILVTGKSKGDTVNRIYSANSA